MKPHRAVIAILPSLPLAACLLAACGGPPGPVIPETRVERQMIGLLEKFDRWDFNGDGFLDASELGEAERMTGAKPEAIIDFYDLDGDGRISLREAQLGYARSDEAQDLRDERLSREAAGGS